MKWNFSHQNVTSASGRTGLKRACLKACQKILEGIAGAKRVIFNESRGTLRAQEHLLQLALNEAEAVAWQTAYPDLVFPVLATEKVQAVIAWDAKVQNLRRARYESWNARLNKNPNRHQPGAGL